MYGLCLKNSLICLLALSMACSCSEGDEVRYFGNFEAEELLLPSEGRGTISSIFVHEGESCGKDQVLAVIDTTMLVIERERVFFAIEALRASIPDSELQLDVISEERDALQREFNRIQKVVQSGSAGQKMADAIRDKIIIAQKKYDAIEAELERKENSIKAQISVKESELKMINERVKRCYLKSPFDATVLQVNINEGEYVAEGIPVMLLAKIDKIMFVAWVPGPSLFSLSPGDSVTVFCDRPNGIMASYRGQIATISERPQFLPSMVQTRESRTEQHYKVSVQIVNDGSIKPGMPGEMVPLI